VLKEREKLRCDLTKIQKYSIFKIEMSKFEQQLQNLITLSKFGYDINEEQARVLIRDISNAFTFLCVNFGYDARQVLRITTKMRDAGRRSPPWKPTSSRVPGRPQDGSDGNRIKRRFLELDHKFYADEITATLVEVKYYLQLLSMNDAPSLPENTIQNSFDWLIEHEVGAGNYLDPIQLVPISLAVVMEDARAIQSGHFHPLDRGGRHTPENAFLMLHRSNQLQGNLTVEELIELMNQIVQRHAERKISTR
jgi:DNA-binding TFAR19-related protein (PDSD5 family)